MMVPAQDRRAFIVMYFYSGAPMHFLSGVDIGHPADTALTLAVLLPDLPHV
jgi:hypothetical protein